MFKRFLLVVPFTTVLLLSLSARAPHLGVMEAQANDCIDRCQARYRQCCRNTSPCPDDVGKACLDESIACSKTCY